MLRRSDERCAKVTASPFCSSLLTQRPIGTSTGHSGDLPMYSSVGKLRIVGFSMSSLSRPWKAGSAASALHRHSSNSIMSSGPTPTVPIADRDQGRCGASQTACLGHTSLSTTRAGGWGPRWAHATPPIHPRRDTDVNALSVRSRCEEQTVGHDLSYCAHWRVPAPAPRDNGARVQGWTR